MLDGFHLTSIGGLNSTTNNLFAKQGLTSINTAGSGRNDRHLVLVENRSTINTQSELIGAMAGLIARYGSQDPARPFQTLRLMGISRSKDNDNWDRVERQSLLENGVATLTVNDYVRVERIVTTYKRDDNGIADTTWQDLNALLTASYIRTDFVNFIRAKYPRHKLGDDGNNYDPSQPIMTPLLFKGEWLGKYREWESAGLVENFDTVMQNVRVVRQGNTRLNIEAPVDLIGQLRLIAGKILI